MTIKHELHVKQAKSAELLEAASPIAREDTTNMCTPPPLCRQGLGTRDNLDIGNDITVRSLGEAIEGAADLCNEDDESD